MKKMICILLCAAALCGLWGCSQPDAVQLDIYRGYGNGLKLLHLNGSSPKKTQRMADFRAAFKNADALDKDISLFAYYPDYKIEYIDEDGRKTTVIADINGEWIDFIYPGPYPEESAVVYRSRVSSAEFKKLVHQA